MNGLCYAEFSATNLERAKTFYNEIFGWEFHAMDENYSTFQTDGIGGGIAKVEEVKSGGPIVYIQVEDIDTTLKVIGEKGGKTVVPKTKISDEHGSFAHFNDSEGNVMGIWTAPQQ